MTEAACCFVALTETLLDRIKPILTGNPPEVIGAVLAELLAMLLAGHIGRDKNEVRETLLELHIDTVRKLIPINEKIILAMLKERGIEVCVEAADNRRL